MSRAPRATSGIALRAWLIAACTLAFAAAAAGQASGPREVVLALRAGEPAEALRLLTPYLERTPRDPALLTLKGIGLAALGQVEDSLRAYEEALRARPDLLAALQGAAELEYRTKKPGAQERLERIVALDSANVVAHGMLGALAYERQDCATALGHFRRARTGLGGNQAALWQLAHCLFVEGRPGEAAETFRQLLDSGGFESRSDDPVRFNLALALHEAGRHREAVATLEPLAASDASDRDVLGLLADAYRADHQLDQAVATLRRATRLFPEDEQFYIALVALCLEHDAFELAREITEIGLRNVPDSARLYAMRGIVHAQVGTLDQALADFERVAEMEPHQPAAVGGLSLTLQQTGRLDQSIALLREQAGDRPDDPLANLLLAQALLRGPVDAAELNEARAALLRAVAADPRLASARTELGKLYLKTGEVEKAIDELERAVALDPSDRAATYQLLIGLRRAGRQLEAQSLAERVRALLDEEKADEIARNRFRLMKAEPAPDQRRP